MSTTNTNNVAVPAKEEVTMKNKSSKAPEVDLRAQLAALMAENEALKAKHKARAAASVTLKVSEKGGVSVYGLGRFPVTLYKEQWLKLLAGCPQDHFILAFIRDHEGELSKKADKVAAATA